MNNEHNDESNPRGLAVPGSVLLFWLGYVAIALVVGFATKTTIASEVWQHIAWGFITSAGLLAFTCFMMRIERGPRTKLDLAVRPSSLRRFSIGVLIGAASFGLHVSIISFFTGSIRFEWVQGVGAAAIIIYLLRFLATSCMEEIGFRGYTLQRLTGKFGVWPAVSLTALIFGLSHLLYGWELQTILLGVVPFGFVWGMSAIATQGLAIPIGLHAAWNFAGWFAGARSEVGPLRMIVEENPASIAATVGLASYLSICLVTTIVFWIVHRRAHTD